MSLKANDYLYSSARIRAKEAAMIGRDKLERMLEAHNSAEAMAQVGAADALTPAAREAWFSTCLRDAYADVRQMLPAVDAIRFLQYPYDCNNIKAVIKAAIREIDPASMLIDCASLPISAYAQMVETNDYALLPKHMAEAAAEAREAYLRTGDPRQIDLILDRACYADMLASAASPFTSALVRMKIDLTNLMITLRVLRMGATEGNRAMFDEAVLHGGEIAPARFRALLDAGEEGAGDVLEGTVCAVVLSRFPERKPSLAALERTVDDVWMERVREARYVSFGEEIPVAYLVAWEYAVKDMRIICAGKDAGLPTEIIRERMRTCYA